MTTLTPKEQEHQDIINAHKDGEVFANLKNMHPDWPRPQRRSKLLSSWISSRGKTKKLRNKWRRKWNTKTLVLSK